MPRPAWGVVHSRGRRNPFFRAHQPFVGLSDLIADRRGAGVGLSDLLSDFRLNCWGTRRRPSWRRRIYVTLHNIHYTSFAPDSGHALPSAITRARSRPDPSNLHR